MAEPKPDTSIARGARDLVRGSATASLATLAKGDAGPWPYASLVTVACDQDGSPILLLSELAEHTKNLHGDPRVTLLFTGAGRAAATGDPLASGRVSVLGRAIETGDARLHERFLAHHEEARGYAGFRDFHFYRIDVTRAHLVAGFGRIHWIEAEGFLYRGEWEKLAQAEADILAHMNADHADAIRLYAEYLLGLPPQPEEEPWRMTGIDPEGCDLGAGPMTARLSFDAAVDGPETARAELVRLTKLARERGLAPDL